jgi:predicted Zn-dependent protease
MNKRLITFMFFISLSTISWGDFGDRTLDWTQKDSDTFRDYAIRAFNSKNKIENNYWAHYWLSEKIQQFQFNEIQISQAPQPILIRDDSINAFALPGNLIGIHTGLWRFARSEDEFLSVLTHEMGHISLDHFSRLSADRAQKGWIIASGIVLSILLANENPEAANATLLSSFAAVNQQNLSFSQAMELEADQFAQGLMAEFGYSTQAGRQFFQRLDQQTFANTQTEFLRTHPLGSTRAAKLSSAEISENSSTQPSVFNLISLLILNHNADDTEKHLAQWLNSDLSRPPSTKNNPHYDYALALYRFAQTESTLQLLSDLTELNQRSPEFLPARVKALDVALSLNDDSTCQLWQAMPKAIFSENMSLDGLEVFAKVSAHCQPQVATQWQASYYWQSGQEEKALNLLRKAINAEQNTNQLARLKNQLYELNERYERLR